MQVPCILRIKWGRLGEAGEGRIVMYEIDGEGMPNELHGRSRAELSGDTGALERRCSY